VPGQPFPISGPIPPEDIVDREDFLDSLETRLADGQSVVLAGPRRTGKTSLAHEVLRRLGKRGFYTGAVDLFRVTDRRELAFAVIDACLQNRTGLRKTAATLQERLKTLAGSAKLAVKLHDVEFDFRYLGEEPDEKELLHYALDLPERLAQADGRSMVVVFDEFQDAGTVADERIYKLMRSYFQNHRKVSYLFLGSKEGLMKRLFSRESEAFFRFAVILPLPPIPVDAWTAYISGKFAQAGLSVNEERVPEIVRLTGGHPQDTMLLCAELYRIGGIGSGRLSLDAVRMAYEQTMVLLGPMFDEMLFELAPRADQRKVLKRIARGEAVYSGGGRAAEIKRALDALGSKALIEKNGRGAYRFLEPLFRDHVLRVLD
jgi:hypothetical protein